MRAGAGDSVYSSEPMSDRDDKPAIEDLEQRLAELEKLADDLGNVPDEEVVGVLNRAVGLLEDINARIEARLGEARDEEREIGDILGRVDFEPFDAALRDLERPSDGE